MWRNKNEKCLVDRIKKELFNISNNYHEKAPAA